MEEKRSTFLSTPLHLLFPLLFSSAYPSASPEQLGIRRCQFLSGSVRLIRSRRLSDRETIFRRVGEYFSEPLRFLPRCESWRSWRRLWARRVSGVRERDVDIWTSNVFGSEAFTGAASTASTKRRSRATPLNVFSDFKPKLSVSARETPYLFLGNSPRFGRCTKTGEREAGRRRHHDYWINNTPMR